MPITLARRVWDKKDQDFKVNLCYGVNSKSASTKKVMFQRQKQTTTTQGIKMISISLYPKEIKLPQNINAYVPVPNVAKLWT